MLEPPQRQRNANLDFLEGGGSMGELMREHDWAATSLGPLETWPQSLRTVLSILLTSRHPIFVWWGRELVQFYNDAYRPILGSTKHPGALGARGRETWVEIWDVIAPMIEAVLERGESTEIWDGLLAIDRHGFLEECYFDYAFSPIRDESGGVGGIFCAVNETTRKVLGERRLRTLRELATRTTDAATTEAAGRAASAVLAEAPGDLPYALLYLLDDDASRARLAGTAGLEPGGPASPEIVDLDSDGDGPWPLAEVARARRGATVDTTEDRHGALPGGPWPEASKRALALPVLRPGQERPFGVLVVGISPRLLLDDEYRAFLGLVAGQVATAIAAARAYEDERARAEALAELDRAKTAFFSNVSHEFRTPLTLLLGPLEDLRAGARGALPPEALAELELAHRNALRLLKLVNTLLDVSRIEAGRVEAVFEPTDLAASTAELASTFRSAVERAGLELAVDAPALPEPVWVDREMWEKIVLNLLSNAFKFTFEGRIAVAVRPARDRVEVEVRDTGVGIPPDELPHLFERFHRVQGVRARTHEGSGIGLALVRELVRLHGGTIRAESRVDEGSVFTVSLPCGSAHLPAERLGSARELASTGLGAAPFVEEALRWLPDAPEGSAEAVEAGSRAPGPAPVREHAGDVSARPRVLLADDNADMRGYLSRLLSERYEVEAVPDGAAALAVARERPPDLVLSDVMMPGLDGPGLLRELRSDPRTDEVPVILLSARAGEEARVEGLGAGADDYLVKPFSARELLASVATHVDLARTRHEAKEALRRAHDQLEALVRDRTSELSTSNAQLRQRTRDLENLNRELEAYNYSVSHDLRAPLRGVDGFAQALLEDYGDSLDATGRRYLERVRAGAQRLGELLDDLLHLSRVSRSELRRRPVDLSALAHDLVRELREGDTGRRVEVAIAPGLTAWGDEGLLRIALGNLLENSWKFTREEAAARIEVGAAERDGERLFFVRDNGAGFDPDFADKLFVPFGRLHSAERFPGNGIGLPIVQRIVYLHGGEVWGEGEEGAGATFSFLLPAGPAADGGDGT